MRTGTLTRFLFLKDLIFQGRVGSVRGGATYRLRKVSAFEVCPRCATKCSTVYDHRRVRVKDSPIRGKHVCLLIIKRRFFCHGCRKVFTEPVAGIAKGARTTERYKREILWAAETFTDLATVKKNYRCSTGYLYKTVYSMLELARRQRAYPWPKVVGFDEHAFRHYKNGRIRFVTAVVDISNHRLYELVDGREALELRQALGSIPGKEHVQWVALDLSETYRAFLTSFFPNARLVADQFHVIRLFTKLLNRKRLEKTGDKRKASIRTLLLRNAEDLNKAERADVHRWLDAHPDVREVYQFKESMRRFYRTKGQRRARAGFIELVDRMGKSRQPGVTSLRKTLLNWSREILAYHRARLTNAMSEGFNRKAKLVQRKAYGYRSFRNYRLRLLNACA